MNTRTRTCSAYQRSYSRTIVSWAWSVMVSRVGQSMIRQLGTHKAKRFVKVMARTAIGELCTSQLYWCLRRRLQYSRRQSRTVWIAPAESCPGACPAGWGARILLPLFWWCWCCFLSGRLNPWRAFNTNGNTARTATIQSMGLQLPSTRLFFNSLLPGALTVYLPEPSLENQRGRQY